MVSIPETKKRFIFRADASLKLGVGHVLRVFSIAEELASRGQTVIFIGDYSEIAWLENRIKSMSSQILYFTENEIRIDRTTDILIIDSYTIDPRAPFISQDKWAKIVAIVDDATPTTLGKELANFTYRASR